MRSKEVVIEVIADSKPLTIVFTCPYCCIENEGIHSEITAQMESGFLDSLRDNRGCQTPCPNCGESILLKADAATISMLKSDKWNRI